MRTARSMSIAVYWKRVSEHFWILGSSSATESVFYIQSNRLGSIFKAFELEDFRNKDFALNELYKVLLAWR